MLIVLLGCNLCSAADVLMLRLGGEDNGLRSMRMSTKTASSSATSSALESSTPPTLTSLRILSPLPNVIYWETPVPLELIATLHFAGDSYTPTSVSKLDVCVVVHCWPSSQKPTVAYRWCIPLVDAINKKLPGIGPKIGVCTLTVSFWTKEEAQNQTSSIEQENARAGRRQLLTTNVAGETGRGSPASESVRYKVLYHRNLFERRGRPFGPPPLGSTIDPAAYTEAAVEWARGVMPIVEQVDENTLPDRLKDPEFRIGQLAGGDLFDLGSQGTYLLWSVTLFQWGMEQATWLGEHNKLPMELVNAVVNVYRNGIEVAGTLTEALYLMQPWMWTHVGAVLNRVLYLPHPVPESIITAAPLLTKEYFDVAWLTALNPDLNWSQLQDDYQLQDPQIGVIDSFLSASALEETLDCIRSSTVFFDARKNYIGGYFMEGLACPILLQIAEEMEVRMPKIFDAAGHLAQAWVYVYGEDGNSGIRMHADQAIVNVNIWLTPDEANEGSVETGDGGGLVLYKDHPPPGWDFYDFNTESDRIDAFVHSASSVKGNITVGYRQNRATMFDSMLFHATDKFKFKPGFENRRINLTLLFGTVGMEPAIQVGHPEEEWSSAGTNSLPICDLNEKDVEVLDWNSSHCTSKSEHQSAISVA